MGEHESIKDFSLEINGPAQEAQTLEIQGQETCEEILKVSEK